MDIRAQVGRAGAETRTREAASSATEQANWGIDKGARVDNAASRRFAAAKVSRVWTRSRLARQLVWYEIKEN